MLRDGANQLGVNLTDEQVEKLHAYLALLQKWNKAYNLTAVRDPAEMVPMHLLDSLAVATFVRGKSVVDVGTGAGLPGIPLAILFADVSFVLLDSNIKKTRFVKQAVIELGLKNVQVCHDRVEQLKAGDVGHAEGFDTVLSRAFAPLDKLVGLTAHLCSVNGRIMAMKSSRAPEELKGLPEGWQLVKQHDYAVPGIDAPRCVLELSK